MGKPFEIGIDELSEPLHVALRQCCDSPATSAAWNLIHLDDIDKSWNSYLRYAAVNLAKGEPTTQALKNAALELRTESVGNAPGMALACILRCFDRDDWDGFGFYVDELRKEAMKHG